MDQTPNRRDYILVVQHLYNLIEQANSEQTQITDQVNFLSHEKQRLGRTLSAMKADISK